MAEAQTEAEAAVLTESEGVQLHLSTKSAAGYRSVHENAAYASHLGVLLCQKKQNPPRSKGLGYRQLRDDETLERPLPRGAKQTAEGCSVERSAVGRTRRAAGCSSRIVTTTRVSRTTRRPARRAISRSRSRKAIMRRCGCGCAAATRLDRQRRLATTPKVSWTTRATRRVRVRCWQDDGKGSGRVHDGSAAGRKGRF